MVKQEKKYSYSLVIPTLNRTTQVDKLLGTFLLCKGHDLEVIIVDQNDDDRLVPIIEKYSMLNIQRIKCEKLGASHARNVGMELASKEIITWPDDDCWYHKKVFDQIDREFNNNKDIAGISINSKDPNDKKSVASLEKNETYINRKNVLSTVIEFCIFIKKEKIGLVRFDINLGVGSKSPYWSDEGPDFVLNLLNNRLQIIYKPNIYLYHLNPIKNIGSKEIKRSYDYGMGRGRFLNKHGYPILFAYYIIGKYIAGICLGIATFNLPKVQYYWSGFKGRLKGYLSNYFQD